MKLANLGMVLAGMLTLTGIVFGGTIANAETKVTFGVGHMCCGKCQAAAKASLTKVSSAVSIEGSNVTVSLADSSTDLVPVLDALRKGGFPANKIDAGSNAVTVGVAHLCCGKCKAGLSGALKSSGVAALDTDGMTMTEDSVTIKAKSGMSLDLIPVLVAMEKGGFSAKSITMATKSASSKSVHGKTVIARAK